MSHRYLTAMFGMVAVVALTLMLAAAQSPEVPRTPWGAPDLQGVWDYRTLTPLERPAALADKAVLTEEEARALEVQNAERRAARDGTGSYNEFWRDPGTEVVETRQTSLIVDPSNGRLSPLTTEAQRRADSAEAQRIADVRRGELPAASWTDLGAGFRCIQHAKAGPPISIGGYNNNVQLFQTPDYVVLFAEQSHDARIIPLDGRAHVGATVRQWIGDARGHWEGDTLVVETVHFNGKHDQIGRPLLSGGENLSLVERFTLSEEDTLLYEYTVTDPTIWVRSWTAQRHMKRNPDLIYEFACHEGNYGIVNTLRGARRADRERRSP